MRIVPLIACVGLSCAAAGSHAPEGPDTIMFRDACDGSAAAALPGGLVMVANDETNLLRVYRPTGARPVDARSVSAFLGVEHKTEADIEAAATLRTARGEVTYWMTSHSRAANGEARPARQRLFATHWDGKEIVPVGRPRTDLRRAMLADARLGFAAVEDRAPEEGGINVEGLADAGNGDLLVGFRSPLVGPRRLATVVPLHDAAGLIGGKAPVRFGAPVLLDLGGRGVRSLERVGGRYLIVAGPANGPGSFALYAWSGDPGERPRIVPAPLADMVPEAMVRLSDGRLLIISDDGSPLCKSSPRAGRRFRGRTMAAR